MTPWQWWWLEEGGDQRGGWLGESDSRAQAIADAQRRLPAETRFHLIEARSSTALKHEESEFVPFLRLRSRETLVTPKEPRS